MSKYISVGDLVSVDQEGKAISCDEDDPFRIGVVVAVNERDSKVDVMIGQEQVCLISGTRDKRVERFELPKPKPKRSRFEMLEF